MIPIQFHIRPSDSNAEIGLIRSRFRGWFWRKWRGWREGREGRRIGNAAHFRAAPIESTDRRTILSCLFQNGRLREWIEQNTNEELLRIVSHRRSRSNGSAVAQKSNPFSHWATNRLFFWAFKWNQWPNSFCSSSIYVTRFRFFEKYKNKQFIYFVLAGVPESQAVPFSMNERGKFVQDVSLHVKWARVSSVLWHLLSNRNISLFSLFLYFRIEWQTGRRTLHCGSFPFPSPWKVPSIIRFRSLRFIPVMNGEWMRFRCEIQHVSLKVSHANSRLRIHILRRNPTR